jgi:hypothetical protein
MVKLLLAAIASVALGAGNYKLKKHKTFNGMEIISGNKEDIQNFKNELDREIDSIKGHADDRIETRYNNLKHIIQKQMIHEVVESIQPITIDGRPWNKTLGLPPLRGSYKSKTLAHDLKSLGYKKDGTSDASTEGVLPDDHYCKNRVPNEGEMQCCKGENTECYTTAGCFCDESCYTKYGDCCTDHFETCYAELKLCLIQVDDNAAGASHGNTSPANHNNYVESQTSDSVQQASDNQLNNQAKKIQARNFQIQPGHAGQADACCLGVPYNSMEEHYDNPNYEKMCCNDVVTWVDTSINGINCPSDDQEEEFRSTEENDLSSWLGKK